MSKQRYPEEFKAEAVKQITERGHKVADVSARLGVSQHSLYQWIKAQRTPAGDRQAQVSQADELRRLKAELKLFVARTINVCWAFSSTPGWRVAASMATAS